MASWSNATVTNKGYALQAKLLVTDKIAITKVVSGSGRVAAGQLVNQTEVTEEKQTLIVEALSYRGNGEALIKVALNNTELTEGYTCNQVGIYASDPDEGEILYAIAQSDEGEGVPSITEQPAGYYCGWVFAIGFGSASGFEVTIDPANALTIEAGDTRYIPQSEKEELNKLFIVDCYATDTAELTGPTKTYEEVVEALGQGKQVFLRILNSSDETLAMLPFVERFSTMALFFGGDVSAYTVSATYRYNGTLFRETKYKVGESSLENSGVVLGDVNLDNAIGNHSLVVGEKATALGDFSIGSGVSENEALKIIETLSADTTVEDIITAWETNKFSLAFGEAAFVRGHNCLALGAGAIAGGYQTISSGARSQSAGTLTKATGAQAKANGYMCEANGDQSDAGGYNNKANGKVSFARGKDNTAEEYYAFVGGVGNVAHRLQTVFGRYADTSTTAKGGIEAGSSVGSLLVVGNGTSVSAPNNAFRVSVAGAVYAGQSNNATGADKAKLREWLDGNPDNEDRRGFFVTLEGNKIRKATSSDEYIFGIVSAPDIASFIDNTASECWNDKYLRDVFGSYIYEDKVIPAYTDEEGVEHEEQTVSARKLNPEWNPDEEYIPREERKEWAVICEMGDIVIRDDGTCQVNGYCKPNDEGIGTASDSRTPFRVMERKDESHVLIYKSY